MSEAAITRTGKLACMLVAALLLVGAVHAAGATITVPDDYATIQAAVDTAAVGDTVYVRNGTYSEGVWIEDPLVLRGESKLGTIVDPGGTANGLTVHRGTNVHVSHLTFRNGDNQGVAVLTSSNVTVADCVATGSAENGILVSNSTQCCITNCHAHDNAEHGILVKHSSSDCTVEYCNASDNASRGIMSIESCTNLTFEECYAEGNFAGIAPRHTTGGSVRDCTCVGNTVGIEFDNTSGFLVEDCTLSSNERGLATTYHSGDSGGNTIRDCEIEWNTEAGVAIVGPSVLNHHFYHNSFIHNAVQVDDDPTQPPGAPGQTWDNGYPSGGNYWSDYEGTDLYSGPDQDEPGCDGIGDTPYDVVSGALDNYPLWSEPCPVECTTWGAIKNMFR